VVESLGRHLLGKLRTGAKADRAEPDSAGAVTAGQPWPQDSIDEGDLTAALGAATAGGAAAVDGLSLLLIEVDDPAAVQALAVAGRRLGSPGAGTGPCSAGPAGVVIGGIANERRSAGRPVR